MPSSNRPETGWRRLATPRDVSAVPGNHDAYVPGSGAKAVAAWRDFMVGDDHHDGNLFPYTRRRGIAGIVGLNSAKATAPFMATGTFDTSQAQRLRAELDHLGKQGLFRIVLIHHPPLRGLTHWHKRLIGASRLRKVIRDVGAELILHGHTHHDDFVWIDGPDGPVPLIGVPSGVQRAGRQAPPAPASTSSTLMANRETGSAP